MNIDLILSEMNTARVDYLLIGGVNFLLRHNGPLTHDVQAVFCLLTSAGSLDIFRDGRGLEGQYTDCRKRATPAETAGGVRFQTRTCFKPNWCLNQRNRSWTGFLR